MNSKQSIKYASVILDIPQYEEFVIELFHEKNLKKLKKFVKIQKKISQKKSSILIILVILH